MGYFRLLIKSRLFRASFLFPDLDKIEKVWYNYIRMSDIIFARERVPTNIHPDHEHEVRTRMLQQVGNNLLKYIHEQGYGTRFTVKIDYFEDHVTPMMNEMKEIGFDVSLGVVREVPVVFKSFPEPKSKYTSLIIADHIDTVRRVVWENRLDISRAVVLNSTGWKVDSRATKLYKPIPRKLINLSNENKIDRDMVFIETRIPHNVIRFIQDEICNDKQES